MNAFFEINSEKLKKFADMSCTAGARPDYVQGGGGNTSVKLADGLMAIKASGFCLKDIRPDKAYAVLDYQTLRSFYNDSQPSELEDVEKAGSAKAKEVTKTIEGLAQLRPSVEAGFHSILDTYVCHTHSVYANLAACSVECSEIVKEALDGADYSYGVVPYTDPGANLTFSIRDEIARVEKETGKRPAIIVMINHGIIAHHDDPDECLRIHADANERIAKLFGMTGESFPKVSVRPSEGDMYEADCGFLREQLTSGNFDERFFLETPLYPDQMVFLIGTFAFGEGVPKKDTCVADAKTGKVLLNMPESKALVIAETLTAVTFIANAIRNSGKAMSTMGEAAKKFIANWESEKYRKSLAGK